MKTKERWVGLVALAWGKRWRGRAVGGRGAGAARMGRRRKPDRLIDQRHGPTPVAAASDGAACYLVAVCSHGTRALRGPPPPPSTKATPPPPSSIYRRRLAGTTLPLVSIPEERRQRHRAPAPAPGGRWPLASCGSVARLEFRACLLRWDGLAVRAYILGRLGSRYPLTAPNGLVGLDASSKKQDPRMVPITASFDRWID